MILSLVEGVLLVALVLTSCVVAAVYRELRRQGDYRLAYERLLSQTAETLAAIDQRIGEINSRSNEVLAGLAARTREARELIAEMDRLNTRDARPPGVAAPGAGAPLRKGMN